MDEVFSRKHLMSGDAAKRYESHERNKLIDTEVDRIFQEIRRAIFTQSRNQPYMNQPLLNTRQQIKETSFVFKLQPERRYQNIIYNGVNPINAFVSVTISDMLPKLLEKLKKVFPDTIIQVDLMKTYIHFDWSIPENLDVD